MTIEEIIRKHMEAMHDELREWMGTPFVEFVTPLEFARTVIREIDKGTMYSSEYMDWYNEEVEQ